MYSLVPASCFHPGIQTKRKPGREKQILKSGAPREQGAELGNLVDSEEDGGCVAGAGLGTLIAAKAPWAAWETPENLLWHFRHGT